MAGARLTDRRARAVKAGDDRKNRHIQRIVSGQDKQI